VRKFFYICALCILFSGINNIYGESNLLKNPDFELIGKDGMPAFWSREYNARLSGPFFVSNQAFEGKNAVCMLTEEWTLDRPQFIVQDVKLPPGVKRVRLSVFAKGQGLFRLSIQFLDLKPKKVQEYFGEYSVAEETDRVFGLGPEYLKYTMEVSIPEGVNNIRVRMGNTIGPLNLTNIWGKAWIDHADLTVFNDREQEQLSSLTITPASLQEKNAISKKISVPSGFRDIAPYTLIVTDPPSYNTGNLVDGIEGIPGRQVSWKFEFLGGTERYPIITFFFPQPIPLKSVCLHLLGNVERFLVLANTDGTNKFNEVIADVKNVTGIDQWISLDLGEKNISGLRIQAIEGRMQSYRSTMPFFDEAKILVREDYVKPILALLQKNSLYGKTYSRPNVPSMFLEKTSIPVSKQQSVKRFRKMLTVDLWMFGIDLKKDTKVIDYGKTESFQKVIQTCRQAGFDSLMLFLESYWKNLVPWPSKTASGTEENILKALAEAVHAEGLKLYVMPSSCLNPPFSGKSLFVYPKEETSRYPQMEQFPDLIFGTYYRDKWLALLDEAMTCGCDGVSLCPDETYYKGHFMETFPPDSPATLIYKQRYGKDLPEHEQDSLAYRQWITLRHESIADLYGYWAKYLTSKYPDIYLSSRFMQPYLACSNITETGMPFDLLGSKGGIHELSSDYMGPYGIQMLAAANGWRKAGMCYDACMWGPLQGAPRKADIEILGEVFWSMMYGLGMIDVYRQNYLVEQGTLPWFARAFNLLKDMEELGIWEAHPPEKIAMFSSRASMDWWQVRAWWGNHNENWDRGIEGNRGWYADRVACNILQKKGLPFDWFFLDNPGHLAKLKNYRVVVIPFAWSISRETAEQMKTAAKNGTRFILLDGKIGQTDQQGEPYEKPILQELVESGAATVIDDDIFTVGGTYAFEEKVSKIIEQILGNQIPLKFQAYGKHVDATILEKNKNECFIFLINWEKAGLTPVDLGTSVSEGTYAVFVRDSDFWYQASINNKKQFTSADLAGFRFWMIPETACVLYLKKSE